MLNAGVKALWILCAMGGTVSGFVLLTLLVRRVPGLYIAAVIATIAAPSLVFTQLASVAGVSIQVIDTIIAVGVSGAAVGAGVVGRRVRGHGIPLLLLGITAFSLANGLFEYGFAAMPQARGMLAMLAATAFFLSLNREDWREVLLTWMVRAGVVMVVVAVWNWHLHGLGDSNTFFVDPQTGELISGRILNGAQAVTLAMAAVVLVMHPVVRSKAIRVLLAVTFAGFVLLSQQRTVMGACAAAVLLLLVARRRRPLVRSGVIVPVIYLFALVTVIALMTGAADPVIAKFQTSIGAVSGPRSTFGDRTDGWRVLVDRNIRSGLGAIVWGEPFGTPYTRSVGGHIEDYAPHNWLVTIFLRTGLLGALATLALVFRMAKNAWRGADRDLLLPLWAIAVVFSVSYSLDVAFAPVFAMLLARPEPRTVEADSASPPVRTVGHVGRARAGRQ